MCTKQGLCLEVARGHPNKIDVNSFPCSNPAVALDGHSTSPATGKKCHCAHLPWQRGGHLWGTRCSDSFEGRWRKRQNCSCTNHLLCCVGPKQRGVGIKDKLFPRKMTL